ncbi:MAG: hypothetical protein HRU41_33645 [Saprospiraceae bacterium]|nr:hypothetical protein [Saprospiraceae bacterium]
MYQKIESRPFFNEQDRLERVYQFASEQQFTYQENENFKQWKKGLPTFYLWQYKYGKKIKNIFQVKAPELGGEFEIFDLWLMDDGGQMRQTTCLLFECSHLNLPKFHIMPKAEWNSLEAYFARQERTPIFPEFPSFSELYQIYGKHPDQIQPAIPPKLLPFFDKEGRWHLEANLQFLLLYRKYEVIPADQLLIFCQLGHKVAQCMIGNDFDEYV